MMLTFLQAAGAANAGSGSMLMSLMPIILIFVIFYVFLILPQNKKQKETQRMLNELKKGDKVVTIGGIYGTVFAADDRTVVLKVDDNTRIKFQKAAISSLIIDAPKNEQPQKKGLLAGLFGKKGAEKTEEKKPEANTDASAEEKASENSEKSEEK